MILRPVLALAIILLAPRVFAESEWTRDVEPLGGWRFALHAERLAVWSKDHGAGALHRLFGEAPELAETRRAWSALSRRLKLTGDEAVGALLGERLTLVIGEVSSDGRTPWMLQTSIDRSIAKRIAGALDPSPRRRDGGRDVFALEGGRYEIVVRREDGGERSVLRLAPTSATAWLDPPAGDGGGAIVPAGLRAARSALEIGEAARVEILARPDGEGAPPIAVVASFVEARGPLVSKWRYAAALEGAPSAPFGAAPAFADVRDACDRWVGEEPVLARWVGSSPTFDTAWGAARLGCEAMGILVDRTPDGDLSATMIARVEDVGGMAAMGDVIMDATISELAGQPRARQPGAGFDGSLPDAIRSRRFAATFGGESRRWSAAWGYTTADGGATLGQPGWWVARIGADPTAESVRCVDRLRWLVRQPSRGGASGEPSGEVRPAQLLGALRALGPGFLDGGAAYESVMARVDRVQWRMIQTPIEGVAWVAQGDALLSAPSP